jgi:hypothetical protein
MNPLRKVFKESIVLIVSFIVLSQVVLASSLEIIPSSILLNGYIGEALASSFMINNTGIFNITDISFSASDVTGYNLISTFGASVTFNSSQIDLRSSESSNISFNFLIQNSTPSGIYAVMLNASNTTYSTTALVILNLDSRGPEVISHTPTGKITISSVVLEVTTNKVASCRYSTSSGVQYDYMDEFSITDDTTHLKSLTNLAEGIHHYYILCKDSNGNIGNIYDASFRVDTPPSANIVLSDSSPVKAGTITVTLITSEEVSQVPSLDLTYDGISYTSIPLIGSDTTWTGYFIVSSSVGNAVGSFRFSAKDLSGNTGTEIKTGGIFIVDTLKPALITDIEAIGEEGSIKLKWHYTEDVEQFNIYRGTSPQVGYTELYRTVTDAYELTDTMVESGKTYYYRVTAVDEAGNEAELSKEVYATALLGNGSTPVTETKLAQELIGDVDKVISSVNQVISEADDTYLSIALKPQNEQDIFSKLKLKQKIDNAKSELKNLKNTLEGFKSQDLTKLELDKKLSRIDLQIRLIKKSIPETILVNADKVIKQQLNTAEIEKLVEEIYPELNEKERAYYLNRNQDFLDKIDISLYASLVSIGYLDGSQEDITLIEREIKSLSDLKNITFIEVVPKTIAESMNEIEVKTLNYKIIKHDPIFSFDSYTKEIVYVINKEIDLNNAEEIKLIPLLNLESETTSKAPVTGFFINLQNTKLRGSDIVAIVFGIVVIVFLLLYYFFLRKSKFKILKINLKNNPHSKGFINLQNLISKTEKYLKQNKLDLASDLYNIILSSYALHELSNTEKEELHNKITELCAKIDSYHLEQELSKAEYYLAHNRRKEALELLYNIKVIHDKLPKEYQSKFHERYDNFCRIITKT